MHGAGPRRRSALVSALATAALVGACGGGEPDAGGGAGQGGGPPDPAARGGGEPAGPLPVGMEADRVVGYVMFEGRQGAFGSCDGGDDYRVEGPATLDLFGLYGELLPGLGPDEALFVDVLAEVGPPPDRGGWVGTLEVLEVHRAAFEGWSCDDPAEGVVAEARGNEPFWRLEVRTDSTRFVTPDGAWTWQVDGPPAPSPEGWRITGTTHEGTPFLLALGVGGCLDSMSGAWSRLDARLAVNEEEWLGCGWLGAAAGPDAGVGGG